MKTNMGKGLLLIVILVVLGGCTVRPTPLTTEEIETRARKDLTEAFSDQAPVQGPITLTEAMARAILYNLDHRTALMERALADTQLTVSRYEMLPDLATSAGYTHRSEYYGAYSRALTGPDAGQESLIMSTSREKNVGTADIAMVWNVLDFGVSYARARQQAENYMIIEEQRRKAVQSIMQEVRYAYWRAQAAQHLMPAMADILSRTETALEKADRIRTQKIQPIQVSLEYQQALLENMRLVKNLIREMSSARRELSTLMNLPPGTPFSLAPVDWQTLEIPRILIPPERLEQTALTYRPELRQEDYKVKISALEARKAILEMLPGINLDFGYNYDSNDFLYANSWASAGAAVSLNIFKLFSGQAKYKAAKTMQELDKMRRKALTMAVLTQVHISVRNYREILEEFQVNQRLLKVNRQLTRLLEDNARAGKSDDLEVILGSTDGLVAQMRHHLVYADLQNALGLVYGSAGVDLAPETVQGKTLSDIARGLKQKMGEFGGAQ